MKMVMVLIALTAMAVVAYGGMISRKIARIERLIKDFERRVNDVAEAGKVVNRDLRVTQQQVDEAIKRAKLQPNG